MKKRIDKELSIFDRVALGFLNLLVALPTGILLWAALNGVPWAAYPWLPVTSIVWFTALMTLLGVISNSVILVNFYGWIWRALVRWFSGR